MRAKNLDPTNFDDLVKFMEAEEKAAKDKKAGRTRRKSSRDCGSSRTQTGTRTCGKCQDTLTLLKDISTVLN